MVGRNVKGVRGISHSCQYRRIFGSNRPARDASSASANGRGGRTVVEARSIKGNLGRNATRGATSLAIGRTCHCAVIQLER